MPDEAAIAAMKAEQRAALEELRPMLRDIAADARTVCERPDLIDLTQRKAFSDLVERAVEGMLTLLDRLEKEI